MKSSFCSIAFVLAASAFLPVSASAQDAPRPPAGGGGGGFQRPLADAPRMGNPGAGPRLTMVEFKALLEHWADFDANKNKLIEKDEVPELFAALFDQADANHDGKLDEKERAHVAELAMQPQPVVQQASAQRVIVVSPSPSPKQ